MIRFLADQNFNARILRGFKRPVEHADILTVADVGLAEAEDAEILAWAAENERVVLTHDVNTLVGVAQEQVRLGQPMGGVIPVGRRVNIGAAIEDLVLIASCVEAEELIGQVLYLPL